MHYINKHITSRWKESLTKEKKGATLLRMDPCNIKLIQQMDGHATKLITFDMQWMDVITKMAAYAIENERTF